VAFTEEEKQLKLQCDVSEIFHVVESVGRYMCRQCIEESSVDPFRSQGSLDSGKNALILAVLAC